MGIHAVKPWFGRGSELARNVARERATYTNPRSHMVTAGPESPIDERGQMPD